MEDSQLNLEARNEIMGLSLRDMFFKYVRFLPVFILSVAITLLGAYVYLRYAERVYSSTGTLVIKSETGRRQGDKFEELFRGDEAMNIQSEVEVMKSKGLMSRVVEKLGLQYTYYVKGKIRTINIYKATPFRLQADSLYDSTRSFSIKLKFEDNNNFRVNDDPATYRFDQPFRLATGIYRLVRVPGIGISKDYRVDYSPAPAMAGFYASRIQVAPKTVGTSILNISIQTANPLLCKDIIDVLMAEYGDYTKELKNQASDQMIDFIDERMKDIGGELDSVTSVLLAYMQRNNLVDIDLQKESNLSRITESDKQLNELVYQRNTASIVEDYLRDPRNENGTVVLPSSLGLSETVLDGMVTNYNAVQVRRQELLEGNVPVKNPVILEMDQQIRELRQNILNNLVKIRGSMERSIASLRQTGSQARGELQELPYKDREYAELKKQVENKQMLYNVLVEKREQTAISRASSIANSQIIEQAYFSATPIKPKRRNIQLLAILAGLAIPALFIFVGEMMNDKITTRYDVEKITAAPILGEIGHSFSDDVLIVNTRNRSMVAEQFRIIRSNLQYVVGKTDRFTLMITSTFGGEGKSFVSTNVGAVMALAGRKTVILEFDIRKPKLISGLKMEKGPGITNFLIGKAELAGLPRPVAIQENLYVLGCGPVPPNPGELLLTSKMDELFDWLKKEFEVVIVDTAPVGMVSDAQTLGKYADATIYLVRQDHTFKKQVSLIEEFYQLKKLPKVTVVINDVKLKAGYGYYGYGRYGYGHGYGYDSSYYEEETPPDNFFEKWLGRIAKLNPFRKRKKR